MKNSKPSISSLDNPLYYLENFRTVVQWVRTHHADLLTAEELAVLDAFAALPIAAQGLLVRMVMRSGELFRLDKLAYPELGCTTVTAVQPLLAGGWLEPEPLLDLDQVFALFTRAEVGRIFADQAAQAGIGTSASKRVLFEALQAFEFSARPLAAWWPDCGKQVVEIVHAALFERVRLMFFGNLRQGWSEFVLTELGRQRYERVPFTPESRAFSARSEVDTYLRLYRLRERLEGGEAPAQLWAEVPQDEQENTWLEERRGRVLYALGHAAERQGDLALALEIYAQSGYSEALVRRLRVMEREQAYAQAWPLLEAGLAAPQNAAQQQALERIHKRACRKLGRQAPVAMARQEIPEVALNLPYDDALSVEQAAAIALSETAAPVFYVENWLFNGLFALLCWPALYAPLRGAFFHPFHAGPADLFRDGFVARRQAHFDACLDLLGSSDYRERILHTWADKQGTSSYFMHWELCNEEVLNLALACIPAADLRRVFTRMLSDLRHHRAGLPDLVRFVPGQRRYELLEVKGPGDRLQDNQRRWFEFFLAHDIPARVCHVSWTETP